MTTADYGIATEDVVQTLVTNNPMLSIDAAYTVAGAVLNILEREGWLIEPPICQYANAAKTVVCEEPIRPGRSYCPTHGTN